MYLPWPVCVPLCCMFRAGSAHLPTLDFLSRQHHSLLPYLPSLVWASLIASTETENEAVSMATCWAVVGAWLEPYCNRLLRSAPERKTDNNPARLMNIDNGGGAFNTACVLFVQYLMWEGLYPGGSMHYVCLWWFSGVMRRTKQLGISCHTNALLLSVG